MTITEHPNLTCWRACYTESVQGAMTTREGAFHSPWGTVEVLSQNYCMPLAKQVNTQSTRFRMVYGGIGWEYANDYFYEQDRLSRLASAFARLVAYRASGRKAQLVQDVSSSSTTLAA